jgi:uncharacterized protein
VIAVLYAVLRVVVILFVVRLVLRVIAELIRPAIHRPAERSPQGADMVRDRVCNTFIPRDRALRAVVAGREEFFCSPECRRRSAQLPAAPS